MFKEPVISGTKNPCWGKYARQDCMAVQTGMKTKFVIVKPYISSYQSEAIGWGVGN